MLVSKWTLPRPAKAFFVGGTTAIFW